MQESSLPLMRFGCVHGAARAVFVSSWPDLVAVSLTKRDDPVPCWGQSFFFFKCNYDSASPPPPPTISPETYDDWWAYHKHIVVYS